MMFLQVKKNRLAVQYDSLMKWAARQRRLLRKCRKTPQAYRMNNDEARRAMRAQANFSVV
jgi:hypothetical protein